MENIAKNIGSCYKIIGWYDDPIDALHSISII